MTGGIWERSSSCNGHKHDDGNDDYEACIRNCCLLEVFAGETLCARVM